MHSTMKLMKNKNGFTKQTPVETEHRLYIITVGWGYDSLN